jgi:hypothetical protein
MLGTARQVPAAGVAEHVRQVVLGIDLERASSAARARHPRRGAPPASLRLSCRKSYSAPQFATNARPPRPQYRRRNFELVPLSPPASRWRRDPRPSGSWKGKDACQGAPEGGRSMQAASGTARWRSHSGRGRSVSPGRHGAKAFWPGPALVSPGAHEGEEPGATWLSGFSWAALAARAGTSWWSPRGERRRGSRCRRSIPSCGRRCPAARHRSRPRPARVWRPVATAGRWEPRWETGRTGTAGALSSQVAEAPKAASPAPPRRESTHGSSLPRQRRQRAEPAAGPQAGPGLRTLTAEAWGLPPLCNVGDEMFTDVPASDPFCAGWSSWCATDRRHLRHRQVLPGPPVPAGS